MAPPRDGLLEPCASCEATCCRHYAIYVLPTEIERIAAATGFDPAEFVDVESHDLAPDLPAVILEGRPSQLILAFDAEADVCALLDPETRLCTIHGVRPHVCRMYPFTADPGEPIQIRLRGDIYCSGDYPITAAEEDDLREQYLHFWTRALDRYWRQVLRFNRGGTPGGLEQFLAFCRRGD